MDNVNQRKEFDLDDWKAAIDDGEEWSATEEERDEVHDLANKLISRCIQLGIPCGVYMSLSKDNIGNTMRNISTLSPLGRVPCEMLFIDHMARNGYQTGVMAMPHFNETLFGEPYPPSDRFFGKVEDMPPEQIIALLKNVFGDK